jgi:pre-mRNA-splicing factor SYF2
LEKQRQLAETLRSQAQAEEEGFEDDLERMKNWSYTIEENDAWEKRLKRKKGRSDFEFHGTFLITTVTFNLNSHTS